MNRKQAKSKTSFSMVMNKVLVGAIILTSLASGLNPVKAEAATNNNKVDTKATITSNYEVSVDKLVYEMGATVRAIELMKKNGTVTDDLLKELATELVELEKAVTLSGKDPTQAVINAVLDAELVLEDLDGNRVPTVQALITVTKQKLGIKGTAGKVEETQKKAAVALSDISSHWGKSYITQLVGKGGITGYPDGTFKPDRTISKAEFLSIALRSVNGGVVPAKTTDHWASGLFNQAVEKHVLMNGEMPADTWDAPITRYEMTVIMTRLLEEVVGEGKVSTTGVQSLITDYIDVSKEKTFTYYVEQAYMKGLISGFPGGRFGGNETGTRAQAATMVVRMIDKTKREVVNTVPTNPTNPTGSILKQTDKNRPLPKAGDTFITADGKEVVLKVHPETGVLGAYQNVSLYEGMVYPNGNTVKEGTLGTDALGYPGQPYYVDSATKTGLFREDWKTIQQYELNEALKTKSPKEGQKIGTWTQYLNGDWYWVGPSIK